MKLDKPLSPNLQRIVGQVSTQTAGADPKVAAQEIAAQQAPGLAPSRAELDTVAQQLVDALGLKGSQDLAKVTQADCMGCAETPMEAAVMWSLIIAVQVHCPPVEPVKPKLGRRKEALPKLDVEAFAGEYQDRPQPVRLDPLVLKFKNVEPTSQDVPTSIYLVNRSNLDDPQPVKLPADLLKAEDGEYAILLGDAWMAEHGIKPGNVLELYQHKGEGAAKRESPATFVRINKGGPGMMDAPNLPPHDNIGAGPVRELFRKDLDPKPTAVRPERMQAQLQNGTLSLSRAGDMPALEPFAKVVLENLRTGEKSQPVEVAEDGGFNACVAAEDGDPIVVRSVDHSHEIGDATFERLLTLQAGRDDVPMLAENPNLGIDGPPTLNLGRVGLSDDCQRLQSDCGLTPGSIVTVTRAGYEDESLKAIVDQTGSLDVALPFEPHADDVFDVQLQSPFNAHVEAPAGWNAKAQAEVRLEINEDGTLDHVRSEGRVNQANTDAGHQPVAALDNVDSIKSGTPYEQDNRLEIKDMTLRFEPYNRNTGNMQQLSVNVDGRAQQARGWSDWNKDTGILTVQVDAQVSGGWPQDDKQINANLGWGKNGQTSSMGFNNRGVNPIRHAFVGLDKDTKVPVHFQDADGNLFAKATLNTSVDTRGTGSGAGGTQQVRTLRLMPESFERV